MAERRYRQARKKKVKAVTPLLTMEGLREEGAYSIVAITERVPECESLTSEESRASMLNKYPKQ